MKKEQAAKFVKDLDIAIAVVMKKNGFVGEITAGVDKGGNFIIKIAAPAPASTSGAISENAIKRYKAASVKLGLPALGTAIDFGAEKFRIVGLSSDGKRIKATRPDTGETAHDLPLEMVMAFIKTFAANKEAELAATDDVQSVDDAAAFLASLGKKAS